MEKPDILLVDDDPVILTVLQSQLAAEEQRADTARSGEEALKKMATHPYSVVITDLMMPGMTGTELIKQIKKCSYDPVIVVITSDSDIDSAIRCMKQGAYDYLVKPINQNELSHRIRNAKELYELRRVRQAMEQEREVQIERKLDWNLWKENVIFRDSDRFDRNLFANLNTCFGQGHGFGGLITLLSSLDALATPTAEGYLLDYEVVRMLQDNAEIANRALESFQEIHSLLADEIRIEKVPLKDFFTELEGLITSLGELLNNKNQIIQSSLEARSNYWLEIHRDLVLKAIREILINAMKYSKPESSIILLHNLRGEKLLLSFLNEPIEQQPNISGIPQGYENIILEPFFRFTKTVEESYKTLDYGLGLTFVDKVLRRHGGRITAYNVTDYLDDAKGRLRVNFELEFPLFSSTDQEG